jgi:hypothetical protein
MIRQQLFAGLLLLGGGPLLSAGLTAEAVGDSSGYLREQIYDTVVQRDEALVNVQVANSRWPDCTTLESAVADIFRLEGAANKPDQDKALALWKWFRILMSPTGGSYAYEGPRGEETLCADPHKILTVYGHHQCDGQSWAMVALWRAAGYMALDECNLGHTTAALRYRDADGNLRYHSFDPQRRYYHWDEQDQRVATRSVPVMRGMVFRHLTAPRELHSLRTSLRMGETLRRQWQNEGHLVPSGKDKVAAAEQSYYAYTPGKTSGIYAAVGQELQIFVPEMRPETFARSLYEGSRNAACSPAEEGKATLHPQKAGQMAEFIYRLAPPYVVADAGCEVTLTKGEPADFCRLLVSTDGAHWTPVYEKERAGQEHVVIDFGRQAWRKGLPNVYTAYNVLLKFEFKTLRDVRKVGIKDLQIVARRMLNKRTLPNLRPGENVLKVTADCIADGQGLELSIEYRVDGQLRNQTRFIRRFPYYFPINVANVPEEVRQEYDQHFNEGRLQMVAITMCLRPLEGGPAAEGLSQLSRSEKETVPLREDSLDQRTALGAFARSYPHPADLTRRHPAERPERGVRETSGFFPQSDEVRNDDQAMQALTGDLRTAGVERRWIAAEDLGAYPKALDVLLGALPQADADLTLFLCKALARLKDERAVEPLLAKWKRAPGGAPGARYIPDVLATIGDRSVVPALIAPLKKCRFDYRFHVAHALGILGGPEAERALEDLARNDPFPAVREQAVQALSALRAQALLNPPSTTIPATIPNNSSNNSDNSATIPPNSGATRSGTPYRIMPHSCLPPFRRGTRNGIGAMRSGMDCQSVLQADHGFGLGG